MAAPQYEIFALRYAHLAERNQGSNLIFPDDHTAPMPLDFFVWVVKGANREAGGRTILLDTGFDPESAARRNRSWIRSPIAALSSVGVSPEDVQDVVLSHLHWDHAGHWHELPNAKFHLQDAEMDYATGRCMCHAPMRLPFDVEQVCTAVRFVYAERVTFHRASACTRSAGIPRGCRSCRCPPRVAWWCWPRMPRISGSTSASARPSCCCTACRT
jgi:glyoxylase-like metal-dependent hydrolase (beta-lactamase superfamily II)